MKKPSKDYTPSLRMQAIHAAHERGEHDETRPLTCGPCHPPIGPEINSFLLLIDRDALATPQPEEELIAAFEALLETTAQNDDPA